jgi:two-component system response regulator PilR (NtrC family)
MERAVALEQTPTILADSLPDKVRFGDRPVLALTPTVRPDALPTLPESGFSLEAHVAEIERAHLAAALQQANGVRTKAADLLGMSFRSFRYYAKKYEL